nr:hypothetical protein [Tanacetum cinerariifolium]
MSIPDVMVNEEIMKTKAYQSYLAFYTRATIPDLDKARRRPTGVIIRDTPNVSKMKTPDQSLKLKDSSNKSKAQVKELVLHLRFLMSQRPSPETQVKELVLHQSFLMCQKTKSAIQDVDKDDWGSDKEEIILTSDDERTESEREVAKNDENVHDDADEEMHDAENANKVKDDQVMAKTVKSISEKLEKEKVDEEQTKDIQAGEDQAGALISVTQKEKSEVPLVPVFLYHRIMLHYLMC